MKTFSNLLSLLKFHVTWSTQFNCLMSTFKVFFFLLLLFFFFKEIRNIIVLFGQKLQKKKKKKKSDSEDTRIQPKNTTMF